MPQEFGQKVILFRKDCSLKLNVNLINQISLHYIGENWLYFFHYVHDTWCIFIYYAH